MNARINSNYKRTEKILFEYKYMIADYKSYVEVLRNLENGADINLPAFIYSEMPKSKTNKITDPVSNEVINREQKITWLKKKIQTLEAKLNRIEIPKELLNSIELEIFNRRYIQEESWKEICDEIGYTEKSVFKIKSKMISKFSRYL